MGRLLECVKDDSRMVAQKTEEALEALIHAISPPQRCLQVLIPIIISEQAPVLQASIRTLSKLVPRIPTEALLESLPSMLPGLFEVRITPQGFPPVAFLSCCAHGKLSAGVQRLERGRAEGRGVLPGGHLHGARPAVRSAPGRAQCLAGTLRPSFPRFPPFVARFHRRADSVPTSPRWAPSRNPGQENRRSRRRLCRLLLLVVHALTRGLGWCRSCGWCGSTSTA